MRLDDTINAKTAMGLGKAMGNLCILEEAQESLAQLRSVFSILLDKNKPLTPGEYNQVNTLYSQFLAHLASSGFSIIQLISTEHHAIPSFHLLTDFGIDSDGGLI